MEKQIILASASPRRRDILDQLQIPYRAVPSPVKEVWLADEPPQAMVSRLAKEKAAAVHVLFPEACTIAADTIVVADGTILGKPRDTEEATLMLKKLQGIWHEVITGVCVRTDQLMKVDVAKTRVRMRSLTPEEIEAYVASGEPMGKAGAYAIQGLGASLVEEIAGCFYNVVGLPIALTIRLLREAGCSLPAFAKPEHDG